MGREFELKYRATPGQIDALRARYGDFSSISMETTYYDTPSQTLRNLHWTLRRRMENGRSVCTLKTPLPDGSRGEWECFAANIQEGIARLSAAGAPELLTKLTAGGVIPRCGARFTRFAAQIPTRDGAAELALDNGVLLGGGRQIPLCEVEIELKSGSDAAAIALAQALAAEYGLRRESGSKFRRALALAQGE